MAYWAKPAISPPEIHRTAAKPIENHPKRPPFPPQALRRVLRQALEGAAPTGGPGTSAGGGDDEPRRADHHAHGLRQELVLPSAGPGARPVGARPIGIKGFWPVAACFGGERTLCVHGFSYSF